MDPIKRTIKKIRETISGYGMIDPGDVIIVAVSGGPDSVCLLDILHALRDDLRISLVVAHYNHGLRETEDESETLFVLRLAKTMHLPYETETSPFLSAEVTGSLEERARNARYEFLERVRNRFNAQKIALGHHLNDQAETVLMRLLRGSGPSGLAGIPPCRHKGIIRPLIELKREEIESYLKVREIQYVTDSSNLLAGHLRNRIRLELLPSLQKIQPRIIEHLGRLSSIMREEDEVFEKEAQKWVEANGEQVDDQEILIPIVSFLGLSPPIRNRVTRHLIKELCGSLRRINQPHIQAVSQLAQGRKPQGVINLPNAITVQRIYDQLAFSHGARNPPQDFQYLLNGPGRYDLEKIGLTFSLLEMDAREIPDFGNSKEIAYLDAGKIKYPLIVRNPRTGDRFIPLGMSGHRKIKDFFIDLKIPSETRASTPLLVSEDTTLWICGFRIDDRFKVTPKTKKILKITMQRAFPVG